MLNKVDLLELPEKAVWAELHYLSPKGTGAVPQGVMMAEQLSLQRESRAIPGSKILNPPPQ